VKDTRELCVLCSYCVNLRQRGSWSAKESWGQPWHLGLWLCLGKAGWPELGSQLAGGILTQLHGAWPLLERESPEKGGGSQCGWGVAVAVGASAKLWQQLLQELSADFLVHSSVHRVSALQSRLQALQVSLGNLRNSSGRGCGSDCTSHIVNTKGRIGTLALVLPGPSRILPQTSAQRQLCSY
jgi:hypothetical protein